MIETTTYSELQARRDKTWWYRAPWWSSGQPSLVDLMSVYDFVPLLMGLIPFKIVSEPNQSSNE